MISILSHEVLLIINSNSICKLKYKLYFLHSRVILGVKTKAHACACTKLTIYVLDLKIYMYIVTYGFI